MTSPYTVGHFVWRELFSNNLVASAKFYGDICGWTVRKDESGDQPYTMFQAGNVPVAGLMSLETVGMKDVPPNWLSYVSVSDVHKTAETVRQAGGNICAGPQEVKPFGSFVVLQDPQGAVVAGWRSNQGDPPADQRPAVGTFCWEQLNTPDPKAAAAFYAKVFGWQQQPFVEEQGMSLFVSGKAQIASFSKGPQGVPPHWLTYIVVADLAAARSEVHVLGGKVLMANIAVPNVGTFDVIQDNIGAVVALFEPPKA